MRPNAPNPRPPERQDVLPEPVEIELLEGSHWDPGRCLAVYHTAGESAQTTELPAVLLGQGVSTCSRLGTCVVEKIPPLPPEGSVVIGLWEDLAAAQPHLLAGLDRPEGEEAFLVRAEGYVLLTASWRKGLIRGVQAVLQILNASGCNPVGGFRLRDEPVFGTRAIVIDLRDRLCRPETLLELAGLLVNYRGNRLHLLLDPADPPEASPGLRRTSAREFGAICDEYGIDCVPWIALPEGAGCPDEKRLREIGESFRSGSVGLWAPSARDWTGATACAHSLCGEMDLFLESACARALWPDEAPCEGVTVCVDAGREAAREEIADWLGRGASVALHVTSGAWGFVPASPEAEAARLDEALRLAIEAEVHEVAFRSAQAGPGRHWGQDLLPALALLAVAWRPTSGALQAIRRLPEMVFGATPGLLKAAQDLSEALLPLRPESGGEHCLHLAFGSDTGLEESCRLSWGRMLAMGEEARVTLREAVAEAPSRLEHLQWFHQGLDALAYLAARVQLGAQARTHYQAAREGRRGHLALCRNALQGLLAQGRRFFARLVRSRDTGGAALSEIRSLESYLHTLESLIERLEHFSDHDELPPPDALGLPPV